MKTSVLALVSAMATLMGALPALAFSITFDGTDYEIDAVQDSFNNLEPTLIDSPWYGSFDLSEVAASQMIANFQNGETIDGFQFDFEDTPFFLAVAFSPSASPLNQVTSQVIYIDEAGNFNNGLFTLSPEIELDYAVANPVVASPTEPVPEPLTILGTIAAAGFGIAMKKKIDRR